MSTMQGKGIRLVALSCLGVDHRIGVGFHIQASGLPGGPPTRGRTLVKPARCNCLATRAAETIGAVAVHHRHACAALAAAARHKQVCLSPPGCSRNVRPGYAPCHRAWARAHRSPWDECLVRSARPACTEMRGILSERTTRWRCHHLRATNTTKATEISSSPHLPRAVSTSSRLSTVEANSDPRNTAEPTQISAPSMSNSTKAQRRAHHTGQRTGNRGARHELGHQQGLGTPAAVDRFGLAYAGIGRQRNTADAAQHTVTIGLSGLVPDHIGSQGRSHGHGSQPSRPQLAPSSAPVTTSTG